MGQVVFDQLNVESADLFAVVQLEVADDPCVHWLDVGCGVGRQVMEPNVLEVAGVGVAGGVVDQEDHLSVLAAHVVVELMDPSCEHR